MSKVKLVSFILFTIIIMLMSVVSPLPARAFGTVGNGTPGSCTEAALNGALVGGDLINFNCGPDPVTITLTNQKSIEVDTTIDGGNLITLSGGGTTRLFAVNQGVTLVLRNLTLAYGSASSGGAVQNSGTVTISDSSLNNNQAPGGSGGAINNLGTLTIIRSVFSDNSSGGGIAGGIYNLGSLTIQDSTFNNNSTYISGGAIANSGTAEISFSTFTANQATIAGAIYNSGNLSVTDSDFTNNSTLSSNGAGIYNDSVLSINRSVFFANNTADGSKGGGVYNNSGGVAVINKTKFVLNGAFGGQGGGVANEGQLTLLASQFVGNQANGGLGGGLYSVGSYPLVITNSTFSENSGFIGGGTYIAGNPTTILNSTFFGNASGGVAASSGIVSIKNTILAGNVSYNCTGTVTSQGYNLEDAATCGFTSSGDISNTDPLLGPIQDNGGPTWTHALLPTSPAINAGANDGCPGADQRGARRPQLGICDIGAFEYGFTAYLPLTVR